VVFREQCVRKILQNVAIYVLYRTVSCVLYRGLCIELSRNNVGDMADSYLIIK